MLLHMSKISKITLGFDEALLKSISLVYTYLNSCVPDSGLNRVCFGLVGVGPGDPVNLHV